ncbi:HAD-IA family hydrolase [Xylanimonas sp. McL0601]|uniref:HAD-IA family hydrolase n=1 Tax=Xylanimonas sp. McL0601 TaxID=3414739 RepID=UPI003CEB172A
MPDSTRSVTRSEIRHVLFDADGVVQVVPGGWHALVEPFVGDRAPEFIRLLHHAMPTFTGECELLLFLASALAEVGASASPEQVYDAMWHRIDPVAESFALVEALRSNGYGVHLGTNQDYDRGAHMATVLGYDALFDTSSYSYALGVAKPDPAFFTAAARRIGAAPAAILFVDDTLANVEGARAAGLAAVHWQVEDGHAALVTLLAWHGVDVCRTS